jgi:calpain-15
MGHPIYTKPSQGQIWGLLLEKAYARIYGGYSKIAVGYAGDALKDLTGAPSQYIDLKDSNKVVIS